ncbi:hypothetical protein [Roseomonas marmotae]|uniref:Uncharacterized protein n=1 Tax=Roseomonas marmotae TaxID=2768161 RepID=A0ABS3KA48_9PROT|nr:hypothetical protein [Roseomonas marmotae]MBO1074335.1 hypothetical protein [Roseomonas marmotae]QTI78087.1 hypothetical protein IAI58_10145 [Roseomonas marmotae]
MQDGIDPAMAHDPGDSVPEGVAVQQPAPLTEEDRAVKKKLEELGGDPPPGGASEPQRKAGG